MAGFVVFIIYFKRKKKKHKKRENKNKNIKYKKNFIHTTVLLTFFCNFIFLKKGLRLVIYPKIRILYGTIDRVSVQYRNRGGDSAPFISGTSKLFFFCHKKIT